MILASIFGLIIPIYFKEIVDIATNELLTRDEMYSQMMITFRYFVLTSFAIYLMWRIIDFSASYSMTKLEFNI